VCDIQYLQGERKVKVGKMERAGKMEGRKGDGGRNDFIK